MKIIDFHMHPFLNDTENMRFYPGGDTFEEIQPRLEKSGISHICGSICSKNPDMTIWQMNDIALEIKEKLGDFYTPGFHIHPAEVDRSMEEIRRMHALGVKLLGEVVPYMHGWNDFRNTDYFDQLDGLLTEAEKCGMVFSFHTDWSWDLEPIIKAHPGLIFVAAHPGEKESVGRHIERMRKFDNYCLDISGTGILRLGMLEHMVGNVGADRILFGTDYPISNHDLYVHCVRTARISDADKEKIFHLNAERLLGL